MRSPRLLLVAGAILAPLMLGPAAVAEDDDVHRHGGCSDSSRWELDLEREGGRIEVDYEVDTDVAGQRWRVKLVHNGDVFFRGVRETHGRDGSFEVERRTDDASGTDCFIGRAVNKRTGEVCRGTASI
jgi:hypothetical protein